MPTIPPFISPQAYAARQELLRQVEAHFRDPHTNPEPDWELFLKDPTHGTITHVELCVIDGRTRIGVSFDGRNLRFFDALDHLALDIGAGLDAAVRLQANRKGRLAKAYPRWKVSELKGLNIPLSRVIMGAGPWQVVKQCSEDGHRSDYHRLTRDVLSKVPIRQVWKEGKPSRVPRTGREAFYAAAAHCWTKNHHKAGIEVSLEDHLRTIRTALELGDLMHKAHRTPTNA